MMDALKDELDSVVLNVGDIIVDHLSGYVGILLRRERRIDMIEDDLYFWEIRWASSFQSRKKPEQPLDISGFLEEDMLKLSILVGACELHAADKEQDE